MGSKPSTIQELLNVSLKGAKSLIEHEEFKRWVLTTLVQLSNEDLIEYDLNSDYMRYVGPRIN